MATYIDRDAFIDYLKRFTGNTADIPLGVALVGVITDLEREPAADVVKRERGVWHHERLASTHGGTYDVIRCNRCRAQFPLYETRYCPSCGALMQEDEE